MPAAAFLLALLFAGPRAGAGTATPASAAVSPNIVFVLADDLGYADLGAYGQQKIRTPSIDRLAAEGMRFTRHYAGNAVCAPSRSVLMTGLHPGPHADPRQQGGAAGGPVAAAGDRRHDRRAAEGPRLRHRRHRQVGPRPARLGRRPAEAGLRPLLRLQLPAPGPQPLPRLPLRGRPAGRPAERGLLAAPEAAGGRRPHGPEGLRALHGPAVRARPRVGEGARVRAREPRPAVLPLRPDHGPPPRAAGARGLARRVPRASGPRRRTAATNSTCRRHRRAPRTRRW